MTSLVNDAAELTWKFSLVERLLHTETVAIAKGLTQMIMALCGASHQTMSLNTWCSRVPPLMWLKSSFFQSRVCILFLFVCYGVNYTLYAC